MKILVSAYNCSPYKGSEEKLGWSTIKEYASQNHTVYVLTNGTYRTEIEMYIRDNIQKNDFLKNIFFEYIDIPKILIDIKGHLGMILRYRYFQNKIFDRGGGT